MVGVREDTLNLDGKSGNRLLIAELEEVGSKDRELVDESITRSKPPENSDIKNAW